MVNIAKTIELFKCYKISLSKRFRFKFHIVLVGSQIFTIFKKVFFLVYKQCVNKHIMLPILILYHTMEIQ